MTVDTQITEGSLSPEQAQVTTPAEPVLTGDELREALRKQLEYYFSRENLAQDAYLVSQMNPDLYVPVCTVANFKMVRHLTEDVDLIIAVLKASPLVQVDDSGEKVRPVASLQRTTLILRDMPSDASEEEVMGLFTSITNCPHPTTIHSDIGNTWFVQFNSKEDVLSAFSAINGAQCRGTPVRARIKSENLLRSSLFTPKTIGKKPINPEKEGEAITEETGEEAAPVTGYPADMYYNNQMFYQGIPWMPAYYHYDPNHQAPMVSGEAEINKWKEHGGRSRADRPKGGSHGRKSGGQGSYYKRDNNGDATQSHGGRRNNDGSAYHSHKTGTVSPGGTTAALATTSLSSGRASKRTHRNNESKSQADQKHEATKASLDSSHFPPLSQNSSDVTSQEGTIAATPAATPEPKAETVDGTISSTEERNATSPTASRKLADIVKLNAATVPETVRAPASVYQPAKESRKTGASKKQQQPSSSASRSKANTSGDQVHEGSKGSHSRRRRHNDDGESHEGQGHKHAVNTATSSVNKQTAIASSTTAAATTVEAVTATETVTEASSKAGMSYAQRLRHATDSHALPAAVIASSSKKEAPTGAGKAPKARESEHQTRSQGQGERRSFKGRRGHGDHGEKGEKDKSHEKRRERKDGRKEGTAQPKAAKPAATAPAKEAPKEEN